MKLLNSLESEWIKTKNSAVMWLTIGGALFVPLLITAGRLVQRNQTILANSSDGVWLKVFNQNWQFMSIFLLPMGIILVSSLLAQIEFRNNTWKQLYTVPQKVSTIFAAKYTIFFWVLLQFFVLFNFGVYLSVVIPALIYADVPYPLDPFPVKAYFEGNAAYFLYCLPIVALQYLLSLHIRNFIVPLGVGLALMVASLIAVNSEYGYILPYIYGGMKFLINDNRIDETINISHWALGYFLYFSFANYLIFICKTQTQTSKFFKLRPLVVALIVVGMGTIALVVYAHKLSLRKLPRDLSQAEVEQKVRLLERNLGAFILENNTEWTLEERMKFHKVKGLSIAVVDNYKIIWAKGYGFANEAEQIPVTESTIFEPGSLSKSVNALALMQMVQDRKIDLFTDINQYLQTWKFPYDSISKGKKITLANLLTHSAGLGVRGFEGYRDGDKLPTLTQILDGLPPANSKPVRSIFEPNKKMEYSGGGTMISQLLLMDVSKTPYDTYLQQHILDPLEMNSSFYTQPIPDRKKRLAALGYDSAGNVLPYKYPIMVEQAAAGLWTTPTDMCKLILTLQNTLLGKSGKVLTDKTVKLMLTPYLDERSAFGFFVDDVKGHKYFSHEAGNWGFSGAFYGSFENGRGVAIFINSENDQIIKELGNSVIEVFGWEGFDKKEAKKTVVVEEITRRKYLGTYEGENKKVEIVSENGVYYYLVDKEKRKMYFISETEFVNMESPSVKSFEFAENRVVKGLRNKFKTNETVLKKTR